MVLKKTYLLRTIHIVGLVSYYISFPNFISVEYTMEYFQYIMLYD